MGTSAVEDAAGGTAAAVLDSGFRLSLFGFRERPTSALGSRTSDLGFTVKAFASDLRVDWDLGLPAPNFQKDRVSLHRRVDLFAQQGPEL